MREREKKSLLEIGIAVAKCKKYSDENNVSKWFDEEDKKRQPYKQSF